MPVEQNEVWQERKYLDMDEFNEWVAARKEAEQGNHIVALVARKTSATGENLQYILDLTHTRVGNAFLPTRK